MEFQTLKKSYKKQIVIGALAVCIIGGALTFATTRAKYKLTQDIPLVRGTVNYKMPDMRIVAINTSEDGTNYTETNTVPTSGYNLNTTKSICKIAATDTKDEEITIEYKEGKVNILGVTKKGTRCYLYFDKERDTTKPTISNVTTSVTKTSITVNVSASDDKGVTEYWYQIGSNTAVKKTTSSHTFSGLSAGTTYIVKVYVKDAAGNQSDTTTKIVQTTPNPPITIDNILAGITVKTGTPDFRQVATTDEGVYKVSDGMYGGYSYYWRGAVTNNYVKFAGKCWRIVRINGDKSMRLIYDGATCHANGTSAADSIAVTGQKYNTSYNQSYYVGWTYSSAQRPSTANPQTGGTASNAKTQLESWYNSNIGNNTTYASKIADGKYCNDRNVQSGSSWAATGSSFNYAGYKRLYTDYAPTLSCSNGDIYSLKVGLITADEVEFAGGKNENNMSYYLYNGQNYWTMSPRGWDSSGFAYMFFVNLSGCLHYNGNVNFTFGLRPVINLKSDTQFQAGGNGTQSNPYVVQ